jgi:hypothetical protein
MKNTPRKGMYYLFYGPFEIVCIFPNTDQFPTFYSQFDQVHTKLFFYVYIFSINCINCRVKRMITSNNDCKIFPFLHLSLLLSPNLLP